MCGDVKKCKRMCRGCNDVCVRGVWLCAWMRRSVCGCVGKCSDV